MAKRKLFRVYLIKPSHYDDDGYVIQWVRSAIPSNTLASLYGLVQDAVDAGALGDDVEVDIQAFDETNTVIPINKIVKGMKEADFGFVGLVGVQSNQFPRAIDMSRKLREHDIPVIVGGFHVSGCLAMLPELPMDIREAQALGISFYAGEAEGRLDEVLRDAKNGTLKPLYNYMNDLPDMAQASVPFLPDNVVKRTAGSYTSFDSGRGCPFQCSFCTIINVQGRKSRYRTPDDIERIIRMNAKQGIKRFFITDDNFARNKNWEALLDRMIELREEGLRFKFIIQVDTLCHRLPNFIEKAARAGCNRVFIGLENIDPDALMGAKKRQNKIWEYRKMLQAWKDAGVVTYAGYILGFPGDTPEKIHRNIEIIKEELPLDLIEFFFLTPLPGSEDHQKLFLSQTWMDGDMNKYDLNHRVSHHDEMSDAQWEKVYRDCWDQYFTDEHMERVIRRGAARGVKTKNLFMGLGAFYGSVAIEKIHPLEGGFFRRKVRTQRRSGLPLENPLVFYPRRLAEVLWTHIQWARLYLRLQKIWKKVEQDPEKLAYTDLALTPTSEEEDHDLGLMKTFEQAIPQTHGAPTKKADAMVEPAE